MVKIKMEASNNEKVQDSEEIDKYLKRQITIGKIFFVSLTISLIICIGGAVYTLADIFLPTGKLQEFLAMGFGLQIVILGGLFAGLFFLLVSFYALYKKGNKKILKILFKEKRQILDKYSGKVGVKIIAFGALISICVVIVGILYSLLEMLLLSSGEYQGLIALLSSLSQGQLILLIGFTSLSLIALIILFKYLIDHGYYLILKLLYTIEENE